MSFHIREEILAGMRQLGAVIEAKLSALTLDQDTKLTWARRITCITQVPEVFRDSFQALLDQAPRFPYTVLAPPQVGFTPRAKEKLICCFEDRIIILEQTPHALTSTSILFKDIDHLQVGQVLLYSWLKLCGVASDGNPTCTEIQFNTVTDYLFAPIIKRIRSTAEHAQAIDSHVECAKFDYLDRLNFKLMNYAKSSVLPGTRVVQVILQPEIRTPVFKWFGASLYRDRCLEHICIQTDDELIFIQDGADRRRNWYVRYGGVWNYIPLNKIASSELTPTQDGLLRMTIHLHGDHSIDLLFSSSNQSVLDILQTHLISRRPQ